MILGSTQLMSAVPVILRSYFLANWLDTRATQLADPDLIAQLHIEVRALNKLRFMVVGYFAAHVLVGGFIMSLYNRYAHDDGDVAAVIKARGVNPWFAGYLLAVCNYMHIACALCMHQLL